MSEIQKQDDGFESQLEDIKIRVESFEGPLDLLVHLIKKHQVDVYDIPIALITEQYLEYLDLMQELNLDLASEFLVMAATLIHIKSRMLPLPPEQISIETRIEQLLERLSETQACGFEDLFDDVATRGDMIVTFLALLEMIRLKLIRVFQSRQPGPIRIYKRARPKDAPHPIHDPEDEYKAHHPDPGAGSRDPGSGSREPESETAPDEDEK